MIVVIPSVGYADMLAVTLPAWRAALPWNADLRIVTTATDTATQRIATGCRATPVVTDAWRSDGAAFNKAAALDVAFGFDRPHAGGTVCLALDADVYPVTPVRAEVVDAGTLYGCARHLCADGAELARFQRHEVSLIDLPRRNGGDRGAGYFQLFRSTPGLRFGSFPTAGHYDLAFARSFARIQNLPDVAVLHLGRTTSRNWHGTRKVPVWSQAV